MPRFVSGFALGLFALLLFAGVFSGPAAGAAGPSIAVSVNGETIADGDRIVVPEANITVSVTGDVQIQTVVVRDDGETIHEAKTGATSYEVNLDPDLGARSNTIQVIVKDRNGVLTTHRSTIYVDSLAPDIGLSEPFTVQGGYTFPESRQSVAANLTVNGTVEDASNVTSFSAKVVGGGQSVETETLENGSFRLETSLVLGNSSLIISAEDEYGNRAYRSARLIVSDEAKPEISFRNWTNETESKTFRPTIVATDDVAVQTIRYRIPGQPEVTAVEESDRLLGADRLRVTRELALSFYRAGLYNVTFNVSDAAGNYKEATKTIEYDPVTEAERAKPVLRVRENHSGMYNDSLYHLEAIVENGSVREVFVEATNRYGRTTLYESVYEGQNTTSVPIELDVPIGSGTNEIRIEIQDSLENTHEQYLTVDTANASAYEPVTESPTNTVQEPTESTPTPTTTGPENTRISVIEPTPIEPATKTQSPLSPLLVLIAVVIASSIAIGRRDD